MGRRMIEKTEISISSQSTSLYERNCLGCSYSSAGAGHEQRRGRERFWISGSTADNSPGTGARWRELMKYASLH